MPWLRVGDTAADHPVTLAPLEDEAADERVVNELFGFAVRCAVRSAAHETDYVVTVGTARSVAGSRYDVLVPAAIRAGYFSWVELEAEDGTTRRALKLLEEVDLFHMILKDERAWTNARKRDTSNPALTAPVRERDGDACRWCGQVVVWSGDRKSGRAGTYDHLRPGTPAESPDDLVVACKTCNSKRGDEANEWTVPLMPAPSDPYYSKSTTTFLAKHGRSVRQSERRRHMPAAAASEVAPAPAAAPAAASHVAPAPAAASHVAPAPTHGSAAAASEVAPAVAAASEVAPAVAPAVAAASHVAPALEDDWAVLADLADSGGTKPRFVGSGRNGSGSAVEGGAVPGRAGPGLDVPGMVGQVQDGGRAVTKPPSRPIAKGKRGRKAGRKRGK